MKKIVLGILCLVGISPILNSQNKIENLGPKINSKYSEISPYITPDGSKVFFIREDHPKNTLAGETQDVWWCRLENDSVTTQAKHLGFPFNTISYNSIGFQSADGQLRIIKGVFNKFGQYKKKGYSYMTMTKEGWSDPVGMKIKKYDKMARGQYVGMCLAPSGNVMILSFSEKKGHPRSELYMSKRIDDKTWTKPKKLTGTLDGDFAPFIASDNKTMYFSAYARGGQGNADIFVMKRLDDTWLNWSEPVNLGDKINTSDWDAYFKVSPTGRYAFLVSAIGGSSDIYRLPLFSEKKEEAVIVEAAKPDPVIIVEGIVKDAETNQPLGASLQYTNLTSNSIEGIGRSSVIDGAYKVVLPYGSNFSIGANLEGYYSENLNLDLSQVGEFAVIKKDILLRPIKAEAIIRLNNIFFETAKATLLPTSQNELDALIKILNDNSGMVIEIRGHTDSQGSDATNQKLSEDRAKSVVDYLVSKGIAAERLTSIGFGEKKPATTNDTEEGRAFNRRVEFRIVKVK
ncbi:MAG: OmpA family protein [Bacteroidetes bacterium]|nr:MAG: OmpA family protein [Bacteroidota bacterium]